MLKPKNIFYLSALLIISAPAFCGCAKKISEAQGYAQKSGLYYQKAIDAYESSLASGEDNAQVRLNLGMLYYSRGELVKAIGEFRATNLIAAKKYLGVSYYKLGEYTDALEIFRKLEPWDDAEYLYYYAIVSERLNLYDQAISLYKKIKDADYKQKAAERMDAITHSKQEADFSSLDEKTKHIIMNAPEAAAYPQAGALILYCDESYDVSSDNTLTSTGHFIIKVLNERGKKEFSEVETSYDSTFEKVELEFARVIRPDGAVISVGKKHIRDVSKYMNFPLYSNVRVHIISFPEVTEGAVLEYKVKVHKNRLVNEKDFFLVYPIQSVEPIISCRLNISMPAGRTLHTKILNEEYNRYKAELEPKTTGDKGRLTYTWEFKDIPQIIPEQQMPPLHQVDTTIMLSTFNSWNEVYQWWWGLAKDKIRVNRAIKEKVAQLISSAKTDEEKARAIYNFCAKDIRYVAVEYGQAGYEPHSAEEIFLNKYGDCKDQAILLVSMLREAGLKAYPLLISTKDYYDMNEDFPSAQFNHSIAVLELGKELIFLDPTAETCSFNDLPAGDQSRQVLIFQDKVFKIGQTPLYPAGHNLVKEELEVKVNRLGHINAQKKVETFGQYDQGQRYWLLYTPPQLIEETLKEKIQEVSIGAELRSVDIRNLNNLNLSTQLLFSFEGQDYFIVAGGLYILPQLTKMDTTYAAKEKRDYPIDFEIRDMFNKSVKIHIPDNFRVKFIPPPYSKDSRWMSFAADYSYDGKNTIEYREIRELKEPFIPTEDYPEFKKFTEELAKLIKQRVVLEKAN